MATYTKTIVALLLLTLAGNVLAVDEPKGTMEAADDILPTPYRIRVGLGREIPKNQIHKSMFSIREKDSQEAVSIVSVRQFGAVEADQPVEMVKGVLLDADLNPSRIYTVDISFPGGVLKTIEVAALNKQGDGAKAEVAPLINLDKRFFHAEATPFVADGDKGIGLNYDVKYNLKNLYIGEGLIRVDLQSHGEVSITSTNNSKGAIHNSLNGGLNGSYLRNVSAALPLGDETRSYVYPMGLKVAPAEFEMNRDFSLIDYTAKLLVGGAIPYADYPSILWSKWFGLNVAFTPPTIFTGFTYVDIVKTNGSDVLSRLGHERWDTEFLYDIPLHNQLDLRFAWHWYVGIENSFWENDYEVGCAFYMDKERTHGVVLSYNDGALPPEFVRTRSWRFGYSAKF